MKEEDIVRRFLKQIASKGGKARAARHSKADLSKWAKLGGRPRKDGTKDKGKNKGKA